LPSGYFTAPTTSSPAPKIDPGNLPLSFEQNVGQTSPLIDFLSHGAGFCLYLTHTGFNMALSQPLSQIDTTPGGSSGDAPVVIGMQFLGSDGNPTVSGLDPQQNQSNYLIGNTPSDWHTGITNYAQVQYQNIYPGVTAVYYGTQGQLEYDFVVAPGTDP